MIRIAVMIRNLKHIMDAFNCFGQNSQLDYYLNNWQQSDSDINVSTGNTVETHVGLDRMDCCKNIIFTEMDTACI